MHDLNYDQNCITRNATAWLTTLHVLRQPVIMTAMQRMFLSGFLLLILVACSTPTPVPPPTIVPGALSVLTLGDSQTKGYGDERVKIPETGGYPAMMIVPIIRLRPGSYVVNFGHGGWDSTALVQGDGKDPSQLDLALKRQPPANIICIWIGFNDLLLHNLPQEEESSLRIFTENIDKILSTLSGRGATLAIALLDDPSMRPSVRDGSYIADFAWYHDSHNHQADFERLSRRTEAFNRVITSKASQYGTILVNLSKPGLFDDRRFMSDDGLHPSSAGYAKIAAIWLEALLPYMGNAQTLWLTVTPPY